MTEKRSLVFNVFGANGAVHEVRVEQEINNTVNLSMICSCSKANEMDFCDSCVSMLEGDSSVLASPNKDDFATLKQWVRGSDIEVAMIDLSKAKTELRLAIERVDKCRKKLAKRMLD